MRTTEPTTPTTDPAMIHRITQGGAAFGNLYTPVTDEAVEAALETSWQAGIRAFDTAPHYGVGLSEERVGRFLQKQDRESYRLSTKIGRLLVDDPVAPDHAHAFFRTPHRRRIYDYSADGVERSLAESLSRLGLDRVDSVLIHDPQHNMRAAVEEAAPRLGELKQQGVINEVGLGCNYVEVAWEFVQRTEIDCLMLAGRFTLLDRRAQSLLHECARRGIRVLIAGVFNGGLLAGMEGRAYFNYREAPSQLVAAAQQMRSLCEQHGVSIRAAALQFPFRHLAVDNVVIGAGAATEVRDSLQELHREIPDALWHALDELTPPVEQLPE